MSTFRLALAGVVFCISIYLFVTAPAPLPESIETEQETRLLRTEKMFNAANAINDAARYIYTSRIVGAGLKRGLSFGEDWNEPGIDKGPLPALFLRLAARQLDTKPTRLSLYLGSDAPINKSNLFDEAQAVSFETVKATREPVFSEISATGFIGMYPDIASAQPCVSCHNEHADSPRNDWQLNEVMGATTWTYPQFELGAGDYLNATEQVFEAVEEAYASYLAKVAEFEIKIPIGDGWPDGPVLMLPDVSTFMLEVRNTASIVVVDELVLVSSGNVKGGTE